MRIRAVTLVNLIRGPGVVLILGLAIALSLASPARSACSAYQGNSSWGGTSGGTGTAGSGNTTGYLATLNEYYFGNAANFVEIAITNVSGSGGAAAPLSVWQNWGVQIRTSKTTLSAPLYQAAVTACYEGQITYFWIPVQAFGLKAGSSFPQDPEVLLYDDAGSWSNAIDMFFWANAKSLPKIYFDPGCTNLTTAGYNGYLMGRPYETAQVYGSLGNKDMVRVANGLGPWTVSGNSNGPAASGTTPVIGGTSVTGTILACSVSPSNDGISIKKAITSTPTTGVTPGATVTFQLTAGNQTATGQAVTVSDTLPTGLTYVSGSAVQSPTGGSVSGTGTSASPLQWTTPSLSAGATATLTFSATVDSNVPDGATLTNTASSLLPGGSVPALYATASAGVTNVVNPLTVAKTIDRTNPAATDTVTYTVTVTNRQNPGPTSVSVSDSFPAVPGMTWGTPVLSQGSYSGGVWTVGTMSGAALGGTTSATLQVTGTPSPSTASGTYTNTASITSVSPAEPNMGTPSATVLFTVGVAVGSFNAFETGTAVGATTGRIYSKLAGTAFGLDVVAINAGAQSATFGNNVKLELLANTGTVGTGYGADNCPTSNTVIQTIASAAIASGRSTVNFTAVSGAYRDVRVRISYPTSSPTVTTCSTDSFAIRPSALTISTSANATPPSASATPAVKVGVNFSIQAAATPAGYTAALTLDSTRLTAQDPAQGTVQSGGAVGNLTVSGLSANGSAVNATYTEVGYLYANAGSLRDDSWTLVDQNVPGGCSGTTCDCISSTTDSNANGVPDFVDDSLLAGRYGCSVSNKTSVSFGRFIPDRFAVSGGSFTNRADIAACSASTFTYAGEKLTATFTLTAQTAAGVTTQNYRGNFGRLAIATPGSFGFIGASASNAAVALDTTSYTIATAGSWNNGSAAVTASNVATARSALHAPYAAFQLGIAPVDPDSVTLASFNLDLDATPGNDHQSIGATTEIRFGQLFIPNNYGSELLPLSVPVIAQYYDGTSFAQNTLDDCTSIVQSNVAIGNYTGGLSTSNLPRSNVSVSGALSGGEAKITIAPPKPTATGTFDLALDLGTTSSLSLCTPVWTPTPAPTGANLGYLQGLWCGSAYDRDPVARLTLGVARNRFIYNRENF